MAVPAFVTYARQVGSSSTINVTWPSGVQAGDVALLACMQGSDNLDLSGIGLGDLASTPSGFTRLGRVAQFSSVSTGRGQMLVVCAKVCDGTESGSFGVAFDGGASYDHHVLLTLWRASGGASSFDGTNFATDSDGNNTTFDIAAVTATQPARWVGVLASAFPDPTAPFDATTWTSFTEHREDNDANFGLISVASIEVAAGNTGTEPGTAADSHTWCSFSVLLYGPPSGWTVGAIKF